MADALKWSTIMVLSLVLACQSDPDSAQDDSQESPYSPSSPAEAADGVAEGSGDSASQSAVDEPDGSSLADEGTDPAALYDGSATDASEAGGDADTKDTGLAEPGTSPSWPCPPPHSWEERAARASHVLEFCFFEVPDHTNVQIRRDGPR